MPTQCVSLSECMCVHGEVYIYMCVCVCVCVARYYETKRNQTKRALPSLRRLVLHFLSFHIFLFSVSLPCNISCFFSSFCLPVYFFLRLDHPRVFVDKLPDERVLVTFLGLLSHLHLRFSSILLSFYSRARVYVHTFLILLFLCCSSCIKREKERERK